MAFIALFCAAAIILTSGDPPDATQKAPAAVSKRPEAATKKTPRIDPKPSANGDTPQTDAQKEALVKARAEAIDLLHEASVSYDAAQLPVIEPYLRNADPEIRSAALDAMVVLGDKSAAGLIRNAAKSLSSAEEALKYEKTAAYLELPPANIKEIMKSRKKSRQEKEESGR